MLHIISKLTKMGTMVVTILLVACMTMRPMASGVTFSTSAKDETINPCEDFYGYVCGKWMGVANSKPSRERTTLAKAELIEYLRKAIRATDSHLLTWAKVHFRACMNESALNKIGVRPLAQIVNHTTGSGWNILGESRDNDWLGVHNSYCRLTGQGALLNVEVVPDHKFKRNVVFISPTEQLFVRDVSSWSEKENRQYVEFLTDLWTVYAKEQDHTKYSQKAVKNAIRDVVKFRQRIIEMQNIVRRNSGMTVTTLSTLNKHSRRIVLDWPRFLQSIFQTVGNTQFNKSTVVRIPPLNSVEAILRVIDSTPVTVLLNHIHFYFLERFIQHTSIDMNAKFHQFVKRPLPERSITCVSSNAMKKIVNFIYVKKFFTNKTMATALEVVHNVQEAMSREVSRTTWIDNRTARDIAIKLDQLRKHFGYKIWYKYEEELNNLYNHRMRISNDYFNNILDFETISYRDALQKLWYRGTEDEMNTLTTDPFDVNAAAEYNYRTNTLVIPPVLLEYVQLPALKDFAKDMTFGAFSTIVGYSLSRSLDSLGRQYDRWGNRRNWWGNATLRQLNSRLKCYLEIFQETSVKAGLSLKFTKVDGNAYLDEIVAEYVGLVIAVEAYKRTAPPYVDMDGSPGFHWNFDQVFFHAYAARQCNAPVGTDVRLPHGLRVNTALSNMQPFADAFGCKKTDPMYSTKKCKLLAESNL